MRRSPRASPVLLLLLSCSKPDEGGPPATTLPSETSPTLPSIPFEDTGTWVPMDTGGTVTNLAPGGTIQVLQEGVWALSPSGGPYDAVSGTLQINEWPDGKVDTGTDTAVDTAEPPLCDVLFSLTGNLAEAQNCPDCDVVFEIFWTLVEGDPAPCRDPDLPLDGARWRIGYSESNERIQFDYYDSGVWVDWYTTVQQGDTLRVTFDTTMGVAVEEE